MLYMLMMPQPIAEQSIKAAGGGFRFHSSIVMTRLASINEADLVFNAHPGER
jgi:hypothetical protein